MKLKYYYNLLRGKTDATKPAKLSFQNIRAVIQAWIRGKQIEWKIDGFTVPEHVFEQIQWRRGQVAEKSPQCWNSGVCKVCGCEILGKTMEDRSCEAETPCYPAMFHVEQDWRNYKSVNKIKL